MGFFDFLKVNEFKNEISKLQAELHSSQLENAELRKIKYTADQLSYLDLEKELTSLQERKAQSISEIDKIKADKEVIEKNIESFIQELEIKQQIALEKCCTAEDSLEKLSKSITSSQNKLSKMKTLYKSVDYSINCYFKHFASEYTVSIPPADLAFLNEIAPTVTLKLHSMDVRDLKKAYNDNAKIISQTLEKYDERYTTKANKSIYRLMVLALQAELQNIIYDMKYGKLEDATGHVKEVTAKYMQIASDGNQNIAGTMLKFIGEIEYLFLQAVMIEYEYYVKKEQIKQEQAALREQMRQEAEERKALEQQRQQIEKEESKYITEIENVRSMLLASADNEKIIQLNDKIRELEEMLAQVEHQKEDIIALQNGKAGNVYVISNLGSFGENVFKIGMTRRLNPQDRVNELGDASVPFKFDVHSFIFSDDAVSLEQQLHSALHEKRVNKVNMRKEFFNTSIDDLENLVLSVDPTAEFNSTMLAEEYKQTLSWGEYAD